VDLNDEDFLFQFGLIRETPSGRKPTIASILLFGQDGYLRDVLQRPVIDCQRFLYNSTSTDEGRWHDRVVCDYNLIQTWSSILEWYYRFAEIPFDVDPKTMQRKDQPVDYLAFRESIVNILIHQDYSDQTRKPVIQNYSDMTRFWNPGDAFATIEELLEPGEKEVRNPLIVTAFRRIGFSEHAGWGLRDIFNSWRGLGHLPPEIINDKSKKTFELILNHSNFPHD
jgi:ATP-dependent DNA helicase RecG